MGATEEVAKTAGKGIDALRDVCAYVLEPQHIRRKAKAQSQAMIIKASAELEVQDIRHRAASRLAVQELCRQEIIESIVKRAENRIAENVSSKRPSVDWVHQFFDYCHDVGDEQMQELWGSMLAGEVERPSSYSPRTMNILRHLTRDEATVIEQFACFVWQVTRWPNIYLGKGFEDKLTGEHVEELGLSRKDLGALKSLGLIDYPWAVNSVIHLHDDSWPYARYGNQLFKLTDQQKRRPTYYAISVTKIGSQFARLIGHRTLERHREYTLNAWRNLGIEIEDIPHDDEEYRSATRDRDYL